MKMRTRIAPSPTGEYHIGSLRTLLYDYALAKKYKGQLVVRIEDTDQKRLVEGAMERTLKVIKDYGLSYDEGPDLGGPYAPYVQSQRLAIYREQIQKLLEKGYAYYCFCPPERLEKMRQEQKDFGMAPKYDRLCLKLSKEEIAEKLANKAPYVIRLKVPDNEIISFEDAVRGKIEFGSNEIDDQILMKSDGTPTYHFAVVVDDYLMEITHVLRGEEWIPSTPKQILIYRYFGWQPPIFVHLTVLLDPGGKGKMSKRYGGVSARSFLDDGYLPEAVLNYLMLLGWNPGTDQEIFSLAEFIKAFGLKGLHKKSPAFDRNKLDYFNGFYLRRKSDQELAKLLIPFLPKMSDRQIVKVVPLIKERIKKLSETKDLLEFVWQKVEYDQDLLSVKNLTNGQTARMLKEAITIIERLGTEKTADLQKEFLDLIEKNSWKTGDFFMVLRVAICGKKITPPIVESLSLLEKEEVLARIGTALKKIS